MAAKTNRTDRKPEWREPTVQELGNLRDFVQTGNVNKSATMADGQVMANNEGFRMNGD